MPQFTDSEFWSPDFESETAEDANTNPGPRPRQVLGLYSDTESSFMKGHYLYTNSEGDIAQNDYGIL